MNMQDCGDWKRVKCSRWCYAQSANYSLHMLGCGDAGSKSWLLIGTVNQEITPFLGFFNLQKPSCNRK